MRIRKQGTLQTLTQFPLKVNWSLTDMCNYSCSYCFGQLPIDRNRFSSLDQLRKAVSHIADANRDYYEFTITGGEPTVHPHLVDLLQMIYETLGSRLDNIVVISNGSQSVQYYSRIAEIPRNRNMLLAFSVHPAYMSKEHLTELVKGLSVRVPIFFTLMMDPDQMDKVRMLHQTLTELRAEYPFEMRTVILREPPDFDRADSRYSQSSYEWRRKSEDIFSAAAENSVYSFEWNVRHPLSWYYEIEEEQETRVIREYDPDQYLISGMHAFRNMYCISGVSVLRISPSGKATGIVCDVEGSEYNIFYENPLEMKEWIHKVHCPYRNCCCETNHRVPKFSESEEAEQFVEEYKSRQEERLSRHSY